VKEWRAGLLAHRLWVASKWILCTLLYLPGGGLPVVRKLKERKKLAEFDPPFGGSTSSTGRHPVADERQHYFLQSSDPVFITTLKLCIPPMHLLKVTHLSISNS